MVYHQVPANANGYLVGGLEHNLFSICWESSSQLTVIFFRAAETTIQIQ